MMAENPVIFFDGVCNYCNSTVNFLIKQDQKKILRFSPLQTKTAKEILRNHGIVNNNIASFVLLQDGRIYIRSTAALKLLKHLPWYWQWANIGWLFPAFLRDALYNVIARNRYKWFGKRDLCMIPAADVKSRFLNVDLPTEE